MREKRGGGERARCPWFPLFWRCLLKRILVSDPCTCELEILLLTE